jgi:hypothetical protein
MLLILTSGVLPIISKIFLYTFIFNFNRFVVEKICYDIIILALLSRSAKLRVNLTAKNAKNIKNQILNFCG